MNPLSVEDSEGYEVVEDSLGSCWWIATSYQGLKYWSIIHPEDICGSRQARNTKKDCFDRKTQRALQAMDAHFLMCSFLGETPLQGEVWEGNKSRLDKDFCYIDVSYFDNYENWCRVGNTTQEQYQQFRKFLKEKQNES